MVEIRFFLPLPRRTIFPNDAIVTARKLETSGIAETTGPGIPGWESLNLSIKPSAEPSLLEICRGGERCAKANLSIKPSAEPSLLEICRGGEAEKDARKRTFRLSRAQSQACLKSAEAEKDARNPTKESRNGKKAETAWHPRPGHRQSHRFARGRNPEAPVSPFDFL